MDSIIHQASPTNQNQAELTPLTEPNDGPKGKSGDGRPGRNRGGFLRSVFCCFTGGAESITEPVLQRDPIAISHDEKLPAEPEPSPEQPIVRPVETKQPLLPPLSDNHVNRICCVIDLDETLVHSSFRPIASADFKVPVEIDGNVHQVYVLERPYLAEFLTKMGEIFECILFTASLAKYADEVTDKIDPQSVFAHRLFRESCVYDRGNYVKDLSRLGRELNRTIIIDNSPASYLFQPQNAIPCSSWFDDKNDTLLKDMIPEMELIAFSSPEDFYHLLEHVQMRIHHYNQQNSRRQIE